MPVRGHAGAGAGIADGCGGAAAGRSTALTIAIPHLSVQRSAGWRFHANSRCGQLKLNGNPARRALILLLLDQGRSYREIMATTLAPPDDLEPAIVRTLGQGAWTAIVRGVEGATGIALVEVYALP